MKSFLRKIVLGAALAGALGAASGTAIAQDINIIAVTHGQANDPFWSVVKNGVSAGAKDASVSIDYRAPETFDMVAMSQLIDAAVKSSSTVTLTRSLSSARSQSNMP